LKFDINFHVDRVLFTESKVPAPEQGGFKILWEGMQELKELGKRVNQAELIKQLKGRLAEKKIRDRLKDEKGNRYWDAIPGEKNELFMNPEW